MTLRRFSVCLVTRCSDRVSIHIKFVRDKCLFKNFKATLPFLTVWRWPWDLNYVSFLLTCGWTVVSSTYFGILTWFDWCSCPLCKTRTIVCRLNITIWQIKVLLMIVKNSWKHGWQNILSVWFLEHHIKDYLFEKYVCYIFFSFFIA